MDPRTRSGLLGIGVLFGVLLLAFVIGEATGSVHVFIVVMAVGLVAHVLFRLVRRSR